ncbi:peptidyl-tRNA hydrolase [Candidatus Micrarchaeota archaeon]|nr:peptidyl-tRNA hydrolase [Candidatus Micrarchaeota archaeon]
MFKQVIVMRADLSMGKGKLVAQGSHASVLAYEKTRHTHPQIARDWFSLGMMKVTLKVNGESELLEYYNKAKTYGIPCELVRDAGHTQVEPNTITCFAAGPFDEKALDLIFGKLKLL